MKLISFDEVAFFVPKRGKLASSSLSMKVNWLIGYFFFQKTPKKRSASEKTGLFSKLSEADPGVWGRAPKKQLA
jgi:hypothetical protein